MGTVTLAEQGLEMACVKWCQKLWCVTQVMGSPARGLRSYLTSSGCQSLYSGHLDRHEGPGPTYQLS